MFESGAILLHLGERSDVLMSADPVSRNRTKEWLFVALSSVEMASLPWSILKFANQTASPAWATLDGFLEIRIGHMEPVLAKTEWLDGLEEYSACSACVARSTARPTLMKAYSDQIAHFAAGMCAYL
jgi:glutathione S-transferase